MLASIKDGRNGRKRGARLAFSDIQKSLSEHHHQQDMEHHTNMETNTPQEHGDTGENRGENITLRERARLFL